MDVLFGIMHQDMIFYLMKWKKFKIQAARILTGTNMYASKQLLYLETGWEKLSKRREYHRLVLPYKVLNDLAPAHLRNTLLSYTNQNINNYNFRHNNMQLIYTRTETFRSSFFHRRSDYGTN